MMNLTCGLALLLLSVAFAKDGTHRSTEVDEVHDRRRRTATKKTPPSQVCAPGESVRSPLAAAV